MMKKISKKLICLISIMIILMNTSSVVLATAVEEIENQISMQEETNDIQETREISEEKIEGDFRYTISDNSYITITGYIGTSEIITIPEKIDVYIVKKIGWAAFENCENLVEVILPDSITTIGGFAFKNCKSLEKINYPINWENAERNIFEGCEKLTQIEIIEGVTKIPDYAFIGSDYLQEVIFPNTLREIGSEAFKECTELEKINLPVGITDIDDYVFQNCTKLKEISLPEGITQIGWAAFENCEGLVEVILPNSVTTMGSYVFKNCVNLEKVNYPISLQEVTRNFYESGKIFEGCTKITKIEVPEGVSKLPDYVFEGSNYLKEVVLPSTLKEIGSEAFKECTELEEINLPVGITDIDDYAFQNCTKLKEISLPEGITKIGWATFENCESLVEVILPNSVTTIGSYVFKNCVNLEKVNYPISLQEVTRNFYESGKIFEGCTKITKIEVPEGVSKLPDYVFEGSNYLKEVVLPSTLKEIGSETFKECTELEEISLPEGITKIGWAAFENCESLKSILFPESLVNISESAFNGCSQLEIVVLEEYSRITISLINNGVRSIRFCNDTRKDASLVLDDNNSNYITNFSSNYNGGSIAMTCNYAIKEDKLNDAKSISFKLPNKSELISKSLYHNNELCQNYIEEDNNIITIPINAYEGKITFNIKMTESSNIISYAILNYSNENNYDIIGIINNEQETISVQTASVTNSKNITISGVAGAEQDVQIYVDDVLISTVKTNKVGSYNSNIELPNGSENEVYTIKVQMANNDEVYATTQTKYSVDVPVITGFKMNYGEDTYELLSEEKHTVTFVQQAFHNEKFIPIFEIKFSNSENVASVYVTSDRNNITKRIKAKWNDEKQVFVTEDYFDENDVDYVPGKLDVFYTDKSSIEENINSIDITEENYNEVFKDAKAELISETETNREVKITFANSESVIVKSEELTFEEGIKEILGDEARRVLGNTENFESKLQEEKTIGNLRSEGIIFKNVVKSNNEVENMLNKRFSNVAYKSPINKFNSPWCTWYAFGRMYEQTGKILPVNSSACLWIDDFNNTTSKQKEDFYFSEVPQPNSIIVIDRNKYSEEGGHVAFVERIDGDDVIVSETKSSADNSYGWREVGGRTTENCVMGKNYYSNTGTILGFIVAKTQTQIITEILEEKGKPVTEDKDNIYYQDDKINDTVNYQINKATKQFKKITVPKIPSIVDVVEKNNSNSECKYYWNSDGSYKTTYQKISEVKSLIEKSGKTEEEKQELYKKVDEYERQLNKIATYKSISKFLTSSGINFLSPGVDLGCYIKNCILNLLENDIDYEIAYLCSELSGQSPCWAIDPSGYVYEAVTTNRLKGVKCEAYYLDEENGQEFLWNAGEYNQNNPFYTDSWGQYAWDVPEGKWKVKYSLDGYEDAITDWLDVPPPQTDVNIGLVSYEKPKVRLTTGREGLKLEFSKYMKPETISNVEIKYLNKDALPGDAMPYTIEYNKDETSIDGTVYAKEFYLKFDNGPINEYYYKLPSTVKTYSDVSVEEYAAMVVIQENPTVSEFVTSLSTSKQTIQVEEEFEVVFDIKDINIEKGIIALGGQLEYDTNILELVNVEAQNDWSLTDGFNEGNFKFVTDNNSLITEKSTIFKIKFKAKDTITEDLKTIVKVKNIEASNGDSDIKADDVLLEITVTNKIEDNFYITSEKYIVDNEEKYISRILPNTSLKYFLANVESNRNITVTDIKGNQISEETIIGTGMILKVEELEFTLVVTGDLNGDGEITITDIAKVKLHLIEAEILQGAYFKASDMNYDTNISITDLARMKIVLIGKGSSGNNGKI